jgi:hypothetical protein
MNKATSSKDIVRDLLMRLPDDATLAEIARKVEFVAAVRLGIAEIDRGDGCCLEQVAAQLPTWIS